MNAATPTDTIRWTPRRWFYAIAAAFLVQVTLIFFAAEKPSRLPHGPQFRTGIHLAPGVDSEQQLTLSPALGDPTLFALPNLHGFSGAAWLTFAPVEHHFTDWTNSTHWLELDITSLGKTFLAAVATNTDEPLLIANSLLPPLPNIRPRLTNETPVARSDLTIEGALARRRLLTPIAVPSWPHSNILSNTVIQMFVDADGDVLPPILLSSSGHPPADQFALKKASGARFQPLASKGQPANEIPQITWGKAVFKWHTIPPLATNTLSPASGR